MPVKLYILGWSLVSGFDRLKYAVHKAYLLSSDSLPRQMVICKIVQTIPGISPVISSSGLTIFPARVLFAMLHENLFLKLYRHRAFRKRRNFKAYFIFI